MKIGEITNFLEQWAPLAYQENYDNSGLLIGDTGKEIAKALICLDVTEEILEEAKANNCGLIIAHHPLIFGGLKRLTGRNYVERIAIKAIQYDIAIYAIHTNLDNVNNGVNKKICDKLGLKNCKILEPKKGILRKLTTFAPNIKDETGEDVPAKVREALWKAGAGHIGDYDKCSYNVVGTGTFRAQEGADPYIGEEGELVALEEVRLDVIYPAYLEQKIIAKLTEAHPYEEVAYDLVTLENEFAENGAGMIGELEVEMDEIEFLKMLKKEMQVGCIRHTAIRGEKVKKVAVCGGSGSQFLHTAMRKGADVFITADFKYHQFFDADGRIIVADIGHYESEQFTIELLYEKISEKFRNFALLKTTISTNPINYL